MDTVGIHAYRFRPEYQFRCYRSRLAGRQASTSINNPRSPGQPDLPTPRLLGVFCRMGFLSGMSRQSLTCMLLASFGAVLFVSRPRATCQPRSHTDMQGFDNGWWDTILGSPTFLRDYGSCGAEVQGVSTCNLSTAQLSAGSSVQSAGISE